MEHAIKVIPFTCIQDVGNAGIAIPWFPRHIGNTAFGLMTIGER